MWRLLTAYRWELWLLIGIHVVSHAVLLSSFYYSFGWHTSSALLFAVAALTTAILLGVSYLRVKRLGRDFLTLVWGYALAAAVIAALIRIVWASSPLDLGAPLSNVLLHARVYADESSILLWHMKWMALGEFASLPALMAFARRASRFSLAHAYSLFLITQPYRITWAYAIAPPVDVYGGPPSVLALGVLLFIISLTAALVLVWLLGNFESRGPRFHRRATAALAAAWVLLPIADSLGSGARGTEALVYALRSPLLILSFLLFTFIPLAVIYLVRARDPKSTTPPAPAET